MMLGIFCFWKTKKIGKNLKFKKKKKSKRKNNKQYQYKFYLNANNPSDKFNEYLFNLLKVLNEFSKHIKFNTDNRFNKASELLG